MLAFDVPELYMVTVQVVPEPAQEVNWAWTSAFEVNDPKSPNTNPDTAIAEVRVIAIRITVASTGETAFLFKPFCRRVWLY